MHIVHSVHIVHIVHIVCRGRQCALLQSLIRAFHCSGERGKCISSPNLQMTTVDAAAQAEWVVDGDQDERQYGD